MSKEIERKFLVKNLDFKKSAERVLIKQGFLSTVKDRVVRVRIKGEKAYITIKGISSGTSRTEFEYKIPLPDAEIMLYELCEKPIIEKYRYLVKSNDFTWEVDEFMGENEGLIIAEIELQSEEQPFEKPDWVGHEVTDDPKYYNSNLIKNPYSLW
jgi:adenylate cyclase